MVSPGPNRSPGAGLLHTTEADVGDEEDGSSEEGDRGVGGAASERCP